MTRTGKGDTPEIADSADIDAQYGLEPVFEPGSASATELGVFVAVGCPYCGESFETQIDLTAGSCSYVEDCQVCCQPIELQVRVTTDGAFGSLAVHRLD